MLSYTLVIQGGTHVIANATAHMAILLSRAGLNLDPNRLSQRMVHVHVSRTLKYHKGPISTRCIHTCTVCVQST